MDRVLIEETVSNLENEIEMWETEECQDTNEYWSVEDLQELLELVEKGNNEEIIKFAKSIKAESFLKLWTEQDKKNLDYSMYNVDRITEEFIEAISNDPNNVACKDAKTLLKFRALCSGYINGYTTPHFAEILKGVDHSKLLKEVIGGDFNGAKV
jgi:hypothetical protein